MVLLVESLNAIRSEILAFQFARKSYKKTYALSALNQLLHRNKFYSDLNDSYFYSKIKRLSSERCRSFLSLSIQMWWVNVFQQKTINHFNFFVKWKYKVSLGWSYRVPGRNLFDSWVSSGWSGSGKNLQEDKIQWKSRYQNLETTLGGLESNTKYNLIPFNTSWINGSNLISFSTVYSSRRPRPF